MKKGENHCDPVDPREECGPVDVDMYRSAVSAAPVHCHVHYPQGAVLVSKMDLCSAHHRGHTPQGVAMTEHPAFESTATSDGRPGHLWTECMTSGYTDP